MKYRISASSRGDAGFHWSATPTHLTPIHHASRFVEEEIEPWCLEHFGPMGSFGRSRWWTDGYAIWLSTESDVIEFKLRWC